MMFSVDTLSVGDGGICCCKILLSFFHQGHQSKGTGLWFCFVPMEHFVAVADVELCDIGIIEGHICLTMVIEHHRGGYDSLM